MMIIESDTAKASRYSDDALEAFYIAVENGQARMALQILVDIVATYADKIDELEKFCNIGQDNVGEIEEKAVEAHATVEEQPEVKETQAKTQSKAKAQEKESE